MKIFLDDSEERSPEWLHLFGIFGDGNWQVYRNSTQLMVDLFTISLGEISHISLDHDLGPQEHRNGADVCRWICETYLEKGIPLPVITSHSMNPDGKLNIEAIYESARAVQDGGR